MEEEEKYVGELPKHVIAQLQEHTAGGYILFRISGEGEIITDLSFDDEVSYLALVKKATSTLGALNKIDDIKSVQVFSSGMVEQEDEEDDDEDGEENWQDGQPS